MISTTTSTTIVTAAETGGSQAEYVVLVDENDNPVGVDEKVRCHLPNGRLHRAFTALLFEEGGGGLILARRARGKMLWPGHWDGTFASHPRESETYVSSCERRMPEELGASARFDYLHKFEYHVPYKDIGSENEICGTLVGTVKDPSLLVKVAGEIDSVRAVGADSLAVQIAERPTDYCPWMLAALYLLDRSDGTALEKHARMLGPWMEAGVRKTLLGAIGRHMPRDAWRMVGR